MVWCGDSGEIVENYISFINRNYAFSIIPVFICSSFLLLLWQHCRSVAFAFWFCLFLPPFMPVWRCDIAHISTWNGPYHMLKRYISYDEKSALVCNCLVYSRLHKTLIFHEFALDGKSAYNILLFRGLRREKRRILKICNIHHLGFTSSWKQQRRCGIDAAVLLLSIPI